MRQLWSYRHTQLEDEMWVGSLLEVRQHLPRAETHQISSRIQRAERDNSRERCEGDIKGSHWVKNPTADRGTNKFKGAFTPGLYTDIVLKQRGFTPLAQFVFTCLNTRITFWCRMLTESRLSQLFGGGLGSIPFQSIVVLLQCNTTEPAMGTYSLYWTTGAKRLIIKMDNTVSNL